MTQDAYIYCTVDQMQDELISCCSSSLICSPTSA